MITRRRLIGASLLGAAALLSSACGGGPASADAPATTSAVTYEVTHTNDEWRKLLNAQQYAVLRQASTEEPFSSPLLHEERAGTFGCAGCQLDLFSSTTKFDSQTGWPSFWAPLDNAVISLDDRSLGMLRSEIRCRRCGGHLGHLFDDGPKPTGLRYCMNGVALTFKPASA